MDIQKYLLNTLKRLYLLMLGWRRGLEGVNENKTGEELATD